MSEQFLEKLTEMARTYGWSGDYIEVMRFIEWCYEQNGETVGDLTPFDDEDEQ